MSLWIKSYGVTIQMIETSSAVLLPGTTYLSSSNFSVCGWNRMVGYHSNKTSSSSCFSWFKKMEFGNFVEFGLLHRRDQVKGLHIGLNVIYLIITKYVNLNLLLTTLFFYPWVYGLHRIIIYIVYFTCLLVFGSMVH